MSEIIKNNTLFTEIENLKQKKDQLSRMSAFAFFSIVTHLKDKQLIFLMRQSCLFDIIYGEMVDSLE